jgi:putative phosphoesterase
MRIAVVSDIHGNRTAFEAVLAYLRQTAPDLILHGGDLAASGAGPVEIVDQIRDLAWPGVMGNVDEMLFAPESLTAFAPQSPSMQPLVPLIEEMAEATREVLGEARLEWLRALPMLQTAADLALVHASPATSWRAPQPDASDEELESIYLPLGQPIAVYGHIHRPFIRKVGGMIVANSGSVSLSYDGDRRSAYLLVDDGTPAVRRVEYDVDWEMKALAACGLPHSAWIARTLATAQPQMP